MKAFEPKLSEGQGSITFTFNCREDFPKRHSPWFSWRNFIPEFHLYINLSAKEFKLSNVTYFPLLPSRH